MSYLVGPDIFHCCFVGHAVWENTGMVSSSISVCLSLSVILFLFCEHWCCVDIGFLDKVLLGSMGALSLMTILSVVIGKIFQSVPAQFQTSKLTERLLRLEVVILCSYDEQNHFMLLSLSVNSTTDRRIRCNCASHVLWIEINQGCMGSSTSRSQEWRRKR